MHGLGVLTARRARRAQIDRTELDHLWSASPVGLVEVDLEQRITDCNKAFAVMVGMPLGELQGRHGWTLFHPDSPPAQPEAVRDLLSGARATYSVDRLLRGRDGAPLAVKLDWSVVRDRRGQPAALACFVTDVSSQAATAASLEAARGQADVLWDRAPIGIIEGSPDGVITRVNDMALAMLGYRREDLLGTPVAELAEATYAPCIAAGIEGLLAGQSYSAERSYRHADGHLVPVHVSTAALRDERGAVTRLVGFVVDMTDTHAQRGAVEEALRLAAAARDELGRRQAFADALMETVDVGIVSCDATGGGVVRNRAQREMLGLDDDGDAEAFELRAEDGSLLSPHDYPLARALRGEAVDHLELRQGPTGSPGVDVLVRGRQMRDASGTVTGAVIAVTDVSAARRATRELAEERRSLAEAKRIGRLGSFTYVPQTGAFAASAHLRALWGLPEDGPVEVLAREATHPDDTARTAAAFAAALAEGGRHAWTFRVHRPSDGALRHLSCTVEVVHDEHGQPLTVTGTHQDITDLVEAEQRAVRASELFEAILSASPDYTFVTDLQTGAVVYGSPGKQVLGHSTEQLQTLGPGVIAALVHPEDQQRMRGTNIAAGALADGEVFQIRYRGRHEDGTWRWVSRRVTPFRRDPATGVVLEVLGVMRDVTDVVQAEERLSYAALHDPLTGLPNRTLMLDRLAGALTRAQQGDHDVAVLFVDLDGFKRVNDTAGHAAGDAVLVEAADRIRSVLRDDDTLARVGGDEFVVVVEPWSREGGVSAQDAAGPLADGALAGAVAQRIVKALRRPVTVDGTEHLVSASIGITYAGVSRRAAGAITAGDLLQEADAAMYRAKHLGTDRFEVFEHGLRADLIERGRVEKVLRLAVASGRGASALPAPRTEGAPRPGPRLSPAYQPVFDLDTGRLLGFEALARLTDPEGRAIRPDVFIEVAESTGQVRDLGLLMLDRSCAQLAAWRAAGPEGHGLTMAVNVSALQASHAYVGDDVRGALQRYGLRPRDLVLELTETALLQAGPSTLAALRQLHQDGVGIAIDDFGTGYASLRYLATLPVTAVKVDKSFTAGLPDDTTCDKIVRAVAGLAADLGLDCVVEGVETIDQQLALPPGVQVQGYLRGRPLPADQLDLPALACSGLAADHRTFPRMSPDAA